MEEINLEFQLKEFRHFYYISFLHYAVNAEPSERERRTTFLQKEGKRNGSVLALCYSQGSLGGVWGGQRGDSLICE